MALEIIGGILICMGLYGIYKQQQIYTLKKYPPGSGKIITTKGYTRHNDPKDTKYFRVLRYWTDNKGRNKSGGIDYEYYQECEIWE